MQSPEDGFVDISEAQDGTLLKQILVEGSGDELPPRGCLASVHYIGRFLADGGVFDSSRERDKEFRFTVGDGDVIKGWDVGVVTMKKGEKAILRCAPSYAYDEKGSLPKIPPNAHLEFEVELLKWDAKPKEPEAMTVIERAQHVEKCKDLGNNAFKTGDWVFAIYAYEEGLRYISYEPGKDGAVDPNFDHGGEDQANSDLKLAVSLLNNLGACYLKADDHSTARDKCSEVLNLDPANVKALYRRAQAYHALGFYDNVLRDVARLLELEPDNKAALQLRRSVDAALKKDVVKEKAMFSKMFSDMTLEKPAVCEVESESPQKRAIADPQVLAGRKFVRARRSQPAGKEVAGSTTELPSDASGEKTV